MLHAETYQHRQKTRCFFLIVLVSTANLSLCANAFQLAVCVSTVVFHSRAGSTCCSHYQWHYSAGPDCIRSGGGWGSNARAKGDGYRVKVRSGGGHSWRTPPPPPLFASLLWYKQLLCSADNCGFPRSRPCKNPCVGENPCSVLTLFICNSENERNHLAAQSYLIPSAVMR